MWGEEGGVSKKGGLGVGRHTQGVRAEVSGGGGEVSIGPKLSLCIPYSSDLQ